MDHPELKLTLVKHDSHVLLTDPPSAPASPSPLTTGTTASSNNTLPSTPDLENSGIGYFFLQKLDDALKREIEVPKVVAPSAINLDTTTNSSINPYAEWKCAFGFSRHLGEPAGAPEEITDFMETVGKEINGIKSIQNGLVSYTDALYSGEYHEFEKEFLVHEFNAARTTIAQLDQVAINLKKVMTEITNTHSTTVNIGTLAFVKPEHKEAVKHAQAWIARARANLVSAHVFYKINYVLGGKKISV